MKITPEIIKNIEEAKAVAINYESHFENKRGLGITKEVGEIFCCNEFDLDIMVEDSHPGYDALDKNKRRVQIKSTRGRTKKTKKISAGNVGSFSKHPFDYCLLAILDENYDVIEVWEAESEKLIPYIEKRERRNPKIREVISVSTLKFKRV